MNVGVPILPAYLHAGMPDLFRATYQNGKNLENNHKIYQMATTIPNGRKID
jgi:hypothetical protein